jgi:hypothetical protein
MARCASSKVRKQPKLKLHMSIRPFGHPASEGRCPLQQRNGLQSSRRPGACRAYEIGLRANKRSVNSADISCANSPRMPSGEIHGSRWA